MIPFAASTERYSEWIRLLLRDGAETSFPDLKGKENVRTIIAGSRMLSVPVEGGSSILKKKNIDPGSIVISSHGRWQEVHLGALKAAYGRTPYFPHIFPEIENIYMNHSGATFEEFTGAIHNMIIKGIGLNEDSLAELKRIIDHNPDHIRRLNEERMKIIDRNLSILDALFRLGKETIFVLI
ncbi:MAG: WbqC family protein [Muribaculaceae bacterium]|nr:WbqC family protein [Muribaculaceae bacterium]